MKNTLRGGPPCRPSAVASMAAQESAAGRAETVRKRVMLVFADYLFSRGSAMGPVRFRLQSLSTNQPEIQQFAHRKKKPIA